MFDLLNHKIVDSLDIPSKSKYSFIWKSPIWGNEIKEYFISEDDSNKRMYYYDKENRIYKMEWPDGKVYLYNYGPYGLSDYYEVNSNNEDTTRVKRIRYNKYGLVDTFFIDNWVHVYDYENQKKVTVCFDEIKIELKEICIPEFTFEWENYLLACKNCNSGFKFDKCFVINSAEEISFT